MIKESLFLDKLKLEEIDDYMFKVDVPFGYQSVVCQKVIIVPANFETDFASVPRIGLIYAIYGNIGHMAALIHDYLYFTAMFPRSQADDTFLEALEVSGIPVWRRYPMWWGVRLGGWKAWNDHRKAGHPATQK